MSDQLSIQDERSSINATVSFNTYLTYSWINNAMFYPIVPKEYYDYYNRFVRQYFYWYDGFNPQFHSQYSGIFSTRLAYTICTKLAGLINGGTLMFDNPSVLSPKRIYFNKKDKEPLDALKFIEKWSYDIDLTSKNNTAIEYSVAGGDSLYKLNSDGTDVYPTVLRKDNYVLDVDFKGKVTGFTGVVYAYTKMRKDDSERNDYYYLLEDRQFDDNDNPQYRIYVKAGFGNLTTNKDINFDKIQDLKWEELPKGIKKAIKENYGNVKLDEWQDLPLNSLGVYQMKYTDSISFLPQLPFGESALSNIISHLQQYDYFNSALATDMYLSRGRVLLPENMQNPQKEANLNQYDGLDSGIYNMVKYTDPSQQKPIAIQFEMRGEAWEKTRKVILQSIAMSLNISERTLANFLTDGSERATAREISVDDATATLVENKRALYRKPLNNMLQDVLEFYGFDDEVVIRFSRVGLNNMNEMVTQMTTMTQNGLVDKKTAIERIFVDKNERQIDEMISRIEKEQKDKQENVQDNMQVKMPSTDDQDTSDEGYEKQNNTDINHTESVE